MHLGTLIPPPIVAARDRWNSVHWNYEHRNERTTSRQVHLPGTSQ